MMESDLVPSLTTGAGSQGIGIVGGEPYTLATTLQGFFVFTSRGIVKATFTGAVGYFSIG